MAIIRRNTARNSSKSKEIKIASLKNELSSCKKEIKRLRSQSTDGLSKFEAMKIERDLEVEIHKKKVLKRNLAKLGIISKQGRPRKIDSEKYSNTRNKFTAMLLPENLSYLKELKDSNSIDNISSFLDSLIEKHRNLHQ